MKTASPTCFPRPGTYHISNAHVNLLATTQGARIHYTLDNTPATLASPVYRVEEGLINIGLEGKRDESARRVYTIRAIAAKDGMEPSDEVTFHFEVELPPTTRYTHRVIRPGGEQTAILCVEDYDQNKMYFLLGKERGLLIDLGNDSDGDLYSYLTMLAEGLPFDAVVLHGHPDHVAQYVKMKAAGVAVYMNHRDIELAKSFSCDMSGVLNIDEGDCFLLGGASLRVYAVPGHTPGCLVIVNEEDGNVYCSDALGNSRSEVPDSGWLQFGNPESAMDCFLSAIQGFRYKTRGKLSRLFGGHNHNILDADIYLANLEAAVQKAVDEGECGLSPSLRSEKDSYGSTSICVTGDYMIDLHWAAVNTGLLFTPGLTPENNALLSFLGCEGARCNPPFDPWTEDYILLTDRDVLSFELLPMASCSNAAVEVSGKRVERGECLLFEAVPGQQLTVTVTAQDGKTRHTYRLIIQANPLEEGDI